MGPRSHVAWCIAMRDPHLKRRTSASETLVTYSCGHAKSLSAMRVRYSAKPNFLRSDGAAASSQSLSSVANGTFGTSSSFLEHCREVSQ
jgi:hypothetical protein